MTGIVKRAIWVYNHSTLREGEKNRTETLIYGTVDEAIAANRVRLCSFCANRDGIRDVAIEGD